MKILLMIPLYHKIIICRISKETYTRFVSLGIQSSDFSHFSTGTLKYIFFVIFLHSFLVFSGSHSFVVYGSHTSRHFFTGFKISLEVVFTSHVSFGSYRQTFSLTWQFFLTSCFSLKVLALQV